MLAALLLALLPMKSLQIGGEPLRVEIADTEQTREKGLMDRDHLDQGTGMLFVFHKSRPLSFWMKNTQIPLSIGFFDEKKRLFQIIDMPVPEKDDPSPPLFTSTKPARYALEVPLGWFQAHEISLGMEFSFQYP